MAEMDQDVCPHCGGSGFVFVTDARGVRYAKKCECRIQLRNSRNLTIAKIPERYQKCTLETFDTSFQGADKSLSEALLHAKKFVECYPLETDGRGLLFTGAAGLGKTHLAIGVLRALIEKGAHGIFFEYGDLLAQIKHSYNDNVSTTEYGLLEPLFNIDVLVLDDLGGSKPSDWVWDKVAHILNSRYNNKLTTILTTNFSNLPPGAEVVVPNGGSRPNDTLGDRIGERMRSRLQEMCLILPVRGKDFRNSVKRASFGRMDPKQRAEEEFNRLFVIWQANERDYVPHPGNRRLIEEEAKQAVRGEIAKISEETLSNAFHSLHAGGFLFGQNGQSNEPIKSETDQTSHER